MLRCRHIASLWACSLLLVTIFAGHASGQGAKDKGGPVLRELEPIWRRTNELIDAGRYKEAEASARQSVARAQALVGADHRAASRGYHDLARVLILEGRYQEAEQLARRGLVIRERDLGPTAEPVSFSLTTLAQALGGQGRDTEAEDAFRRALAIREQHSGQQGYEYARLNSTPGLALRRPRPHTGGRAAVSAICRDHAEGVRALEYRNHSKPAGSCQDQAAPRQAGRGQRTIWPRSLRTTKSSWEPITRSIPTHFVIWR